MTAILIYILIISPVILTVKENLFGGFRRAFYYWTQKIKNTMKALNLSQKIVVAIHVTISIGLLITHLLNDYEFIL